MNKKFLFYILSTSCISIQLNAQAQKNAYFQQEVNNTIQVTLDDVSHYLRGDITIEYINNSPDTLNFIYFHLWPNAYSSDKTAYNRQAVENGKTEFYMASKMDWGYIDSLSFKVDQEPSAIVPTDHKDIVKLLLNSPLLPGESIKIYTPFKIQLPTTFSRLGHHNQSYQITQWYPKPAVYDQNGWHPMPYLDQGEFYSEYGRFDVSITLPSNYIVMATGNLQTESEKAFLDSLSQVPVEAFERPTPESSATLKTIRYIEDNIHDFAWFADKNWAVKKGIITLPESKRQIEAWSVYYPQHNSGWQNSISYISKAILGYSSHVGEYPYNTVKAVEGPLMAGGGMEYPTVTIIIPSNDSNLVETIIVHEVGHNWFYGILGSNERQEPWIDESINSFYENLILLNGTHNMNILDKSAWMYVSNNYTSQALSTPAADFTDFNYGADVYKRGPQAIEWLYAYMGPQAFKNAMKDLFSQNKFRHISSENIKTIFSKHTSKNLDWFFDDYIHSNHPVDFKLSQVQVKNDSLYIYIKNKSKLAAPAIIDVELFKDEDINQIRFISDKIKEQYHKQLPLKNHIRVSTDVIKDKYLLQVPLNGYQVNQISISETVPDVQKHNNYFTKGKINRWKIAPIVGLNMNQYKKIYLSPALGYNTNNGFMLGGLIHNITIPAHKLQIALAPLYSFKSNNLYGTGVINYTQYTPESNWLHNIEYNLYGKSFGLYSTDLNIQDYITARYIKLAPEVVFNFRKAYPRQSINRSLSLKAYYINEQNINYNLDATDSLYKPELGDYTAQTYLNLTYLTENTRTYNPYAYSFNGQFHKDFIKLSLEGQIDIDYHYKNAGLLVRGFIGKMFPMNATSGYEHYRYRWAGTYSDQNDYLYDYTYVSRNINNDWGSHQIQIKDAGMKISTLQYASPLGMTDNVIASLNLTSDIPIKNLPFKVFFDIMTFSDAKKINPSGNAFLWDAGIEFDAWGIGSIYFPLFYSQDYKDYINSIYPKNRFFNAVTFKFNIDQIKWHKPLQTIPFIKKMMN